MVDIPTLPPKKGNYNFKPSTAVQKPIDNAIKKHVTPPKKVGAWETESSFDQSATLEELIALPPFHPSSDESGDSYTAAARVPNWMRRRIQKIIEDPNCKYELNSDAIRDAIYLGLRIIHMRYKQTTDWSVQTKIANVEDRAAAGRRVRDRFGAFVSSLEEHIETGEMEDAAGLLADYVGAVVELEDEWQKTRTMGYLRANKTIRQILGYCEPRVAELIDTIPDKNDKDNSKEQA